MILQRLVQHIHTMHNTVRIQYSSERHERVFHTPQANTNYLVIRKLNKQIRIARAPKSRSCGSFFLV